MKNLSENELRDANQQTLEEWKNYMDLHVPLSIELGRTKLTAREILELEVSGLIQLSRSTGEGVDILAENSRIGRGELVMIEDRTGIRVNEITAKRK